jgi:hypothetical protein
MFVAGFFIQILLVVEFTEEFSLRIRYTSGRVSFVLAA